MIRIHECNTIATRLLSICGDIYTALEEARRMVEDHIIRKKEYVYIQRLLLSQCKLY